MRTLVRGGVAGACATVLMSALMWVAQRAGVMGKQPPEAIAEHALERSGAGRRPKRTEHLVATASHTAFGAGGGGLYGALRTALPARIPPVASGVAYGLAVWAVSYKGWVPALRIMPPPERDRPGRPTAMILAHVVYGATLGALMHRWDRAIS